MLRFVLWVTPCALLAVGEPACGTETKGARTGTALDTRQVLPRPPPQFFHLPRQQSCRALFLRSALDLRRARSEESQATNQMCFLGQRLWKKFQEYLPVSASATRFETSAVTSPGPTDHSTAGLASRNRSFHSDLGSSKFRVRPPA